MNTARFVSAFITLSMLAGCQNKPAENKGDGKVFSGPKFTANIRTTEARTPEEERQGFKLPEGFEITLFASEPNIGKPINFAFDAKGRMWVTQSFEYPFPSEPGKGKDKVTIIEDSDHDGHADKFTVFADTLNIPIGVLPVNDGAYVYSIPNIYKYTDANNDGRADGQKKLIGPFKTKDTHGMINNFVRGYDGWIHADHGYTNRDTVSGSDGDSISMISGNTFRFSPDGSHIDHTTDGRINPFGLVYDEMGYLYSTDCHTSPLYQLIRGGDYTQWGKEEGMGYAPDMKSLSDEATALAGLAYYADINYPKDYQKNFFVGDCVRCRVYRYSYTNKGSTPIGKREDDFVLSDDPWFRPVDVKMGPDGALYVADFYNSIIGHYEVPLDHPRRDHVRGRIWRITYKGHQNNITDWTIAELDKLLKALDVDNMAVRMTAADQLSDRIGKPAVQPLADIINDKRTSERKYVHALWVLERLGALSAQTISNAAANQDPVIRLMAMRILLEQKPDHKLYLPLVEKGLQDSSLHVRRAAVELLFKYPGMRALNMALAIRRDIPAYESHLLYTVRLSLRNLLRNDSVMKQTVASTWNEKDAGYLADVLMGVPSAEAGIFLFNYVSRFKPEDNRAPAIFRHIARYAPYGALDSAVVIAMSTKRQDATDLLIFRGIQDGIEQRGAKENPKLALWGKSLAENVLKEYPFAKGQQLPTVLLQTFAADAAGKYGLKTVMPSLESFLQHNNTKDLTFDGVEESDEIVTLKSSAIRALLKIDPRRGSNIALKLLSDDSSDLFFKNAVGRVVGEFPANLVNSILKRVKNAPPELQSNIALTLAGTKEGKDILLEQVKKGEFVRRTLLQPRIQERMLFQITPAQQKVYDNLIKGLDAIDKERQTEIYNRLVEYDKAMQNDKPTIAAGKLVFTQNCLPCHSIAEEGGNIGPNLDGVAQWGPKSLAEKILDPNRNISENFRNYTIRMKDGKVLSGLYRREEGAVTVFADLSGKEFSVAKKDISEKIPSKLTLMPDNFRERLSQKDFNALINFLINHKG